MKSKKTKDAIISAVIKELIANGRLDKEVAIDHIKRPLLSIFKKRKVYGEIILAPLENYDCEFILEPQSYYAVAQLSNNMPSKEKMVDIIKKNLEKATSMLVNRIEKDIFSDGSGALGMVAGFTNENKTLHLSDSQDTLDFHVGADVKFLNHQELYTICSINHDGGTISSKTPFKCVDCPILMGAGMGEEHFVGLGSWIPTIAPSEGDDFYGVDRSVYPDLLAGTRYAGNADFMIESVVRCSAMISEVSGGHAPDVAVMSPSTYVNLTREIGSEVMHNDTGCVSGFEKVEVYGAAGKIRCIPDPAAPSNLIYLLKSDTWTLNHLGEDLVNVSSPDGNYCTIFGDTIEIRLAAYVQLSCSNLSANAVIKL